MIYFIRIEKNGNTTEMEITKDEYNMYASGSVRLDKPGVSIGYAPQTAEDYEELYFGKDYLANCKDISQLDETYSADQLLVNGLIDANGILYKCSMFNHHELYLYLGLKNIDRTGLLRVNTSVMFDNYCNIGGYNYKDVTLTPKQIIAMHNIATVGYYSSLEDFIYDKKLYNMGFQQHEDLSLARANAKTMRSTLGNQFHLPNSYFVFGRDNPLGEELY